MKIMLLSGNSEKTKVWIEEVAAAVREECAVEIVYYDHWKTGEETINLETELKKLEKRASAEDIIFAKSAGCLVALKGIIENRIHPTRCIFAGLPVRWSESQNIPIQQWLKTNTIPTILLQKQEDPAAHSKELKMLIKELRVKNYTLKEIPGNDHHYEDINQIKKLIIKGE